jgi:hypothetical protein
MLPVSQDQVDTSYLAVSVPTYNETATAHKRKSGAQLGSIIPHRGEI